jgi:hypothetical protein
MFDTIPRLIFLMTMTVVVLIIAATLLVVATDIWFQGFGVYCLLVGIFGLTVGTIWLAVEGFIS